MLALGLSLIINSVCVLSDIFYVNTTTADGRVLNTRTDDWSPIHSGETGTNALTALTFLNAQAQYSLGSGTIDREFLYFDTSPIPDDVVVTDVSFYVYGVTEADTEIAVQNGTQADSLTTADFDACQPLPVTGGGEFGHSSGFAIDQWNEIEFNELGMSQINFVGVTKLCVREYTYDYLDSEPAGDFQNRFHSANQGTLIPYLKITYGPADTCTAPGSGDWTISDNCTFDVAQDVVADMVFNDDAPLSVVISAPLTFTGSNQKIVIHSPTTIDIRSGGEIGGT